MPSAGVGPRHGLPEQRSQARARALREATPRPAQTTPPDTSRRSMRSHGREAQHRAASYHSPSDVAIGIPIPDTVRWLTEDGCRPGSDSTIAALRAPRVHGSRGQRHPNTQSANGLRSLMDAEIATRSLRRLRCSIHANRDRPGGAFPAETPLALGVERSTQPRAQRPPETVATGTKWRRVAGQPDYRSCLIPLAGLRHVRRHDECSFSSNPAARGRSNQCAKAAPLLRSRSLTVRSCSSSGAGVSGATGGALASRRVERRVDPCGLPMPQCPVAWKGTLRSSLLIFHNDAPALARPTSAWRSAPAPTSPSRPPT